MEGWCVRDNCARCGQKQKQGFHQVDEETGEAVFWCCACIDEHGDDIEECPVENVLQEDGRCPEIPPVGQPKGSAIHGKCACCSQEGMLGLTLLDEETNATVFMCYACIDRYGDEFLDEFPLTSKTPQTDEPRPDLRRLHSFGRLRSLKRLQSMEWPVKWPVNKPSFPSLCEPAAKRLRSC